ncbi:efflux RND transporter periplasmic adaptor subunit [Comamonas serinivorans]|nr:efflux RND transporter periplasmic adaptor subunit [Comamonas serinivorans]
MGVTVGMATARHGELPLVIEALGTVVPSQQVALTAQVGGVLQEVLFEEGQLVKKGQLLARIDPRTYEQTLAQAKSQTAKDQAQLVSAQQTLKRYETLWQQDSIARQDVDTQAALVKQLQATVMADQASERAAQINLDYTRITAPMAGRIGLRGVDPGNLVSAGSSTAIASIAQITPVDVSFAVPQDRVPDVLAAQRAGALPVTALDRARVQTLATGQFLTLDNAVDTATGTVKAKARFANADYKLFPNQFVNVSLRLGSATGVLVPVSAVRLGPNGNYVYVVDDAQTAHMRQVKRGTASNELVEITEGLQAGERVVTEGGDRVKDGGQVQLASANPAQPASGAGRGMRGRRGGASGPGMGMGPRGAASAPRDGASSPAAGASAPRAAASGSGGPAPRVGSNVAAGASAAAVPEAGVVPAPTAPPAPAAPAPTPDRRSPHPEGMASRPFNGERQSGDTGGRQLPPEVAAKLASMSEAERQAFFAARRAARAAGATASAAGQGDALARAPGTR